MAGEETMDSKRIEELRALVFASMPAVGRKGQPSSSSSVVLQQQKEEKEESKEEGELSSEEENPIDKEAIQSPSPFSSSAMGTTLLSAVTTSVTTSPAHTKTVLKQKGESLSVSISSTTTNVEAGVTTVSLPSITSVQRLQLHTDYGIKGAPTKQFPSESYGFYTDSLLVSQHPATAPRFGCVQKEAEKFSMNLHAPVGSLHGERTDSLVIKFSDEDSDSDAELQQTSSDQIRQNNSENHKLTGDVLFSGQSANLSNQSTISLKSEINRMKRQIASIEQMKKKHRRLSKSSAILASQQDGHQISKATIGHQISVSDLEILRQQIAIKENELQQRKQPAAARSGSGNKISCTGSVSGQGGYPLNPESRNKTSLTVASVAKTSLGKSTEQELLSCKDALGQLGSSEILAVARPIISSEEFFQDSLFVSSTLNTGLQEREASVSKIRRGPGASFPESSENLLFASCQHELPLSPSTSLKGTVLFTDPTSSKVSLLSSFKHMHSDMEETGAGVKKQRLSEPLSRMQPHSCSDEKSSLDDPSCVNLRQGHMTHAHLLSSSNTTNAEIDHVGVASNQGSHPISNCRGFSNSMQVVSSPSESVEPSPAYQLDGGANSFKEGSNQRSEEVTFTSHVEHPTSMVILSENCQDMQKSFMAGSPEAIRYPFGLAENLAQTSRLGIVQGVLSQEIEFGAREIRSLMEEEELIDKELEEAQQDRFNCESIEHLARRKHRESQVNLQLANMRCNILYQKRENLAARIQAAETQYFTNRGSICLPIQHHQGILVPPGCKEHAKRSFWSGKVHFLNERRKSEVDLPLAPVQMSETHQASAEVYRNSKSGNSHLDDPSMVSANDLQTGIMPSNSLAVPDIVMASKDLDQQQGDSAHHTRIIVPRHPTVTEIEEDHNTMPNKGDVNTRIDVVSLKSSTDVGRTIQQHKDKSKANLNNLNQPSVPLDCKAADLSSNDRNPERIIVQNSKTLREMLNSGVEREPLHGFSSASFAMNTDKMRSSHPQDSTGIAINNGHGISNSSVRSNVLNKQSCSPLLIVSSSLNQIQQSSHSLENSLQSTVQFRTMTNCNNVFSDGAKMEEHQMQFNLCSGSLESSMKAQELQKDSCNLEEDHNVKLHRILDKDKSEVSLDNKILIVEAAAHVGNSPVAALSADCGDCHKALEVANISLVNVDNLSEGFTRLVGVSRKVVHDLKKAGLQKSRKNLFNESAEDDVDELEEPIPTKLKSLFSTFQGVVLCRDKNSKSSEEKDLMCCSYLNQTATSVPCSYISPLTMFRSYRICPQFSATFHLPMNSDSWSHSIDPFKPICKFEHRGKCNNDDCPWQHKRDYTLSLIELLNQIQDYSLCSESQSEIDERSLLEQNNRILESSESTAEALVTLVNQINGEHIITRPIISEKNSLPKWSSHLTKTPVYRIGSYIIKGDDLLTLQPVTAWAQRFWKLGFCQSFSMPFPIHRRLPFDMPCLLNSSVGDALLGSTISSALRLPNNIKENNRFPEGAEEQLFKGFEDAESLLELSLNLIDFKVDVETFEACKHALCILSRVLESYPNSAALWIVYLHIYHLHGKSITEEDMFLHAVLYNKGSYVLWLWFINSRKSLRQKLEAFQMAITELGNTCKDKEFSWNEQSSFLLDISLQMLNCMCMSGLISEAIGWINDLISCASKDNELHTSDRSLLLSSLSENDACILWICCGYVIAHKQLPDIILKRLGCKQRLPLGLNWEKRRFTKSCKKQVMMLMQTAASHGRGCLAVEVVEESYERDSLAAKQVMVVNFIECAIACDVDNALATGKKFMELYPTSVELVLACVHLAEKHAGKSAGLDLFEKAIRHWPRHKPGILRLWSQYIAYDYVLEGKNSAKTLLEKCASQIEHNDPRISVSRRELMSEHSDDAVRQALQSLSSIINHKFEGVSTNVSMAFSDEDVVFGFLLLAFFEVMNGDFTAAQIATNKALGSALNEDDVHHCLKEVASLTFLELGCIAIGGPKILCLLDKWSIESRLLTTLQPLSRRFSDSIKKRRVRLFVENLLGPPTVDYSLLNSILEICYGPLLVPEDASSLQEVFNFVEGVLELVPANVPIAAAACKIVHQRFSKSNLTTKTAGLLWSISLLTNALCQSASSVAESLWLESGNMLEQLGADSFLEDFYQIAFAMCPLSTSLWHRVLATFEQTGKLPAAAETIKENGSMLEFNIRNKNI